MCGYCVQSWFIGVRFFKAEICSGSHSLRGYQWSLKDSGARVRTRIARGDQKNQKTPAPDHFWKLRCSKSVHRCGAKHISKSKVERTEGFGAFLDVRMSFCVAGTRVLHLAKSEQNVRGFVAVSTTTTTTLHYATLHSTTLQLQLHYTTLITLHYANHITPQYATLTKTTTTATTTTATT